MLPFRSMIDSMDDRMRLMNRMMDRLGVDPADLAADGRYRRAAIRCLGCDSAGRCEAWLGQAGETGGEADFCPNQRGFRAIG